MLNDPSMVDAAISFAAQLLNTDHANQSEKLEHAFEMAVSRRPDGFEMAALKQLLAAELAHYQSQPEAAEQLLDTADSTLDLQSTSPQELAAWTGITRALMNLQETVTRY